MVPPDYNRACYVDVALTNENTSPTHLNFKVIRLTYNFTVFNITCYRWNTPHKVVSCLTIQSSILFYLFISDWAGQLSMWAGPGPSRPAHSSAPALNWDTSANSLLRVIITNMTCACFLLSTERSGLLLRVCVLQTGARQVAQEGLLSEGTTMMINSSHEPEVSCWSERWCI